MTVVHVFFNRMPLSTEVGDAGGDGCGDVVVQPQNVNKRHHPRRATLKIVPATAACRRGVAASIDESRSAFPGIVPL